MSFEIIPMAASHIDDIFNLEVSAFSSPWSRNDIEYQLENPDSHFLVCVESSTGEFAGYAGVQEICSEAYITNIAVCEKFRRHGAARALLKKAVSDSFERDCEFITLEVRESNSPAISLYESEGFVRAGVRKNFYSDPAEDAIIYTLFNRN